MVYLGRGDQLAAEYFQVDEKSGDVSVRKSLLVDTKKTKTYKVTPQLVLNKQDDQLLYIIIIIILIVHKVQKNERE